MLPAQQRLLGKLPPDAVSRQQRRSTQNVSTLVQNNVINNQQCLCSSVHSTAARPHLDIFIGNKPFRALYDTGASPNCIQPDVFEEAKRVRAVHRIIGNTHIKTASGDTVMTPVALINVSIGGQRRLSAFNVLPNCTSPIILGMAGISQWRLDYQATTNTFSFHNDNNSNQTQFVVFPAKRQTIPPKSRRSLVCFVKDAQTNRPLRHTTVVAEVQDASVLAETDEYGRFAVTFANPSAFEMPFTRSDLLGTAEHFSEFQVSPQLSEQNISSLLVPQPTQVPSNNNDVHVTNHVSSTATPSPFQALIAEATKHLDQQTQQMLQQVLMRNQQCISKDKFDLGLSNLYTHQIKLADTTPVYHKQFPIPSAHLPVVMEAVEKWLTLGIVEPAKSPYNSPIFCVKKKDGGQRLVLDYRGVNLKSHPENYSIRTPEDNIAELGQAGAKYFIAHLMTSVLANYQFYKL